MKNIRPITSKTILRDVTKHMTAKGMIDDLMKKVKPNVPRQTPTQLEQEKAKKA